MEQDAKIEDLTEAWGNMENKFPALEKHDMDQDIKIEDLKEAWGNMENKFKKNRYRGIQIVAGGKKNLLF